MRWARMLRAALIVVFALEAATAGSAAASHRLELVQWETYEAIPVGANAVNWDQFWSAEDGYCYQVSRGKVLNNGATKDKVSSELLETVTCEEEGYAASGDIKEVSWSSSGVGVFKLKPRLRIVQPGPCVYEYSKLRGHFEPGNFVNMEGVATGKLKKSASSPACPQSKSTAFEAGTEVQWPGAEFEPIGSTLSG